MTQQQRCWRVLARDGDPTFHPADVVQNWSRGISDLISEWVSENSNAVVRSECVELPNGRKVTPYLDLSQLLTNQWSRAALLRAAELHLSLEPAKLIVTYSGAVRRFCSELLRRTNLGLVQIDLPDPFSSYFKQLQNGNFGQGMAIVFGDALYSGAQATRVVKECISAGMRVGRLLFMLDSSPRERPPVAPMKFDSLTD